jgi:hypothetical protein
MSGSDIDRLKLSSPGLIPIRLWNELIDYVHSALITSFTGGTFNRTPAGTALYSAMGEAGGTAAKKPFECTLLPQTNPDGTPAGNKVAVEYNSTLFTSLIPLTSFSGITGLYDPNDQNPFALPLDGPDDTSGYTSLNGPDDYVFLEIKFKENGYEVDTVAITTNGNGSTIDVSYDPWDDSGDALVAEDTSQPPKQTFARIVLATYEDGLLQQNVMGNLVLSDRIFDGKPAIYPEPY